MLSMRVTEARKVSPGNTGRGGYDMENRLPKQARLEQAKDKSGNPVSTSSGKSKRSVVTGMWGLARIGLDLAGAVAGFTLLGWWADSHWQTSPRYTLVGVILGLIGGMYKLIRRALDASKDAAANRKDADGDA